MNLEGLANAIMTADLTLFIEIYQDRFILVKTKSSFFLSKPIERLEEYKEDENRYVFFAPLTRKSKA